MESSNIIKEISFFGFQSKRMKNRTRQSNGSIAVVLVVILVIVDFTLGATSVAFGSFACGSRNGRCISGSFNFIMNSNTTSFSDSFSSYYDENRKRVDLETNLVISGRVVSSKARVYFNSESSRIIYNKYEYYEPGIGCALTPPSNCFTSDKDNYVLCCVNGKRGNGAFCMKEEEPDRESVRRAYQMYRLNSPVEYLITIQITITQNGGKRQYTLTESSSTITLTNLLDSQMSYDTGDQFLTFDQLRTAIDDYVLLRQVQQGTVGNTMQPGDMLLVKKLSNFLTDKYSYISKATCDTELGGATKTHDQADFITDQFKNAPTLFGLKNTLKQLQLSNTDSVTVGNTASDLSGLNYFEIDVDAPVILVNLLIENIYEI